jgi:signal peptidase I
MGLVSVPYCFFAEETHDPAAVVGAGWSAFIEQEGQMQMEQEKDTERSTVCSKKGSQENSSNELKEWIQAIFTAVVLALLIRVFLFEIILVDGSSMEPTLYNRNRVFVNKIGYIIGEPQHGDVIIFKTPEDNQSNYVKRLIGLPGDRIRIEKGVVYLNNEPLDEPYISDPPYNDYPEVTVPEGAFFALGDNRNDSKDSRDDHIGFIPGKNLVGKALYRIWPLDSLSIIQ